MRTKIFRKRNLVLKIQEFSRLKNKPVFISSSIVRNKHTPINKGKNFRVDRTSSSFEKSVKLFKKKFKD